MQSNPVRVSFTPRYCLAFACPAGVALSPYATGWKTAPLETSCEGLLLNDILALAMTINNSAAKMGTPSKRTDVDNLIAKRALQNIRRTRPSTAQATSSGTVTTTTSSGSLEAAGMDLDAIADVDSADDVGDCDDDDDDDDDDDNDDDRGGGGGGGNKRVRHKKDQPRSRETRPRENFMFNPAETRRIVESGVVGPQLDKDYLTMLLPPTTATTTTTTTECRPRQIRQLVPLLASDTKIAYNAIGNADLNALQTYVQSNDSDHTKLEEITCWRRDGPDKMPPWVVSFINEFRKSSHNLVQRDGVNTDDEGVGQRAGGSTLLYEEQRARLRASSSVLQSGRTSRPGERASSAMLSSSSGGAGTARQQRETEGLVSTIHEKVTPLVVRIQTEGGETAGIMVLLMINDPLFRPGDVVNQIVRRVEKRRQADNALPALDETRSRISQYMTRDHYAMMALYYADDPNFMTTRALVHHGSLSSPSHALNPLNVFTLRNALERLRVTKATAKLLTVESYTTVSALNPKFTSYCFPDNGSCVWRYKPDQFALQNGSHTSLLNQRFPWEQDEYDEGTAAAADEGTIESLLAIPIEKRSAPNFPMQHLRSMPTVAMAAMAQQLGKPENTLLDTFERLAHENTARLRATDLKFPSDDPLKDIVAYRIYAAEQHKTREHLASRFSELWTARNQGASDAVRQIIRNMHLEQKEHGEANMQHTLGPNDMTIGSFGQSMVDWFMRYRAITNDVFSGCNVFKMFMSALDATEGSLHELYLNIMNRGGASSGKSAACNAVMAMLIHGSYTTVIGSSDKANLADNAAQVGCDRVVFVDEAPTSMTAPETNGASGSGAAGHADKVQRFKAMLTEQVLKYEYLQLDKDEITGKQTRTTRTVESKLTGTLIANTNREIGNPAMLSRFFQILYGWPTDGMPLIFYVCSKTENADTEQMRIFLHEMHQMQYLNTAVNKMIRAKVLPEVNLNVAYILYGQVLMQMYDLGITTANDPRRLKRMLRVCRILTIYHAINSLMNFFGAPLFDATEFHIKQLQLIAPYLYCTTEIAIFALTLFSEDYVPPMEEEIMDIIVHRIGRYPRDIPDDIPRQAVVAATLRPSPGVAATSWRLQMGIPDLSGARGLGSGGDPRVGFLNTPQPVPFCNCDFLAFPGTIEDLAKRVVDFMIVKPTPDVVVGLLKRLSERNIKITSYPSVMVSAVKTDSAVMWRREPPPEDKEASAEYKKFMDDPAQQKKYRDSLDALRSDCVRNTSASLISVACNKARINAEPEVSVAVDGMQLSGTRVLMTVLKRVLSHGNFKYGRYVTGIPMSANQNDILRVMEAGVRDDKRLTAPTLKMQNPRFVTATAHRLIDNNLGQMRKRNRLAVAAAAAGTPERSSMHAEDQNRREFYAVIQTGLSKKRVETMLEVDGILDDQVAQEHHLVCGGEVRDDPVTPGHAVACNVVTQESIIHRMTEYCKSHLDAFAVFQRCKMDYPDGILRDIDRRNADAAVSKTQALMQLNQIRCETKFHTQSDHTKATTVNGMIKLATTTQIVGASIAEAMAISTSASAPVTPLPRAIAALVVDDDDDDDDDDDKDSYYGSSDFEEEEEEAAVYTEEVNLGRFLRTAQE